MKWEEFIKLTEEYPVIELSAFFGGNKSIRVQVSQWVSAGKLVQLKRGYYILGDSYRKIVPYEPHIAGVLKRPSYISVEKALEFYGLIPEMVTSYTSVTTKRQNRYENKIGIFEYRHINKKYFWGYKTLKKEKQTGFIAHPEKAVLDFFYLTKTDITDDFINEMRFQNTDRLDIDRFKRYASQYSSEKIKVAADRMIKYINARRQSEEEL